MISLVFATNNQNKIKEINNLVESKIRILSLKDIHCYDEVPEHGDTLESNASEKALYIYNRYILNCFADDTGLEIEALGGKPGIYSARYAGDHKNADDNINKVFKEMSGITNRKARFRTVISLIVEGQNKIFEGIINGVIINEKRGIDGFGYDPIFIPKGYDKTFAEMSLNEKNNISHRHLAVQQLIDYLNHL